MAILKHPLGQLLTDTGTISAEQLEAGLQAQLVECTRIGTVLVQQEAVSLDAVSAALSAQHGVPAAPQQLLDDRSAVEAALPLVSGALCEQHLVVPLRLEAGTLHLAMCDPTRRLAGEISYELKLPIRRYVVPELRLMYLLERWYGIPRDPRFLRTPGPQQVRNERRTYISATVQPLPDQPAIEEEDLEQTLDLVYLDEYLSPGAAPAAAAGPGAAPAAGDDEELVIDVDEPEAAPAPELDGLDELTIDVEEPVHAPDLIDVVAARLEEADSGETIMRLLVQPVLERSALSVLLWVKERWAVGCCAEGTAAQPEALQRLVLPLDSPSLLQWAYQRKMVLKADGAQDPMLQELAAQLGLAALGEVCVAPVLLNDDVVNLVCFMSEQGTLFSEQAPYTIRRLASCGGAAYRRLAVRIQG